MSEILDSLNTVVANVTDNRKKVGDALANAEQTAGTFDPQLTAAIELVLASFPSPQIAGQILVTRSQIDSLSKTASEMDALLAALQVVIADEELVEATQAQATANVEVAKNPLPEAAGSSESPAAVEAAPSVAPAAAVAQEAN